MIDQSPTVSLPTAYGIYNYTFFESDGNRAILVSNLNREHTEIQLRIHNSCVFSEALGAIDCDCNNQLNMFLQVIGSAPGALLYVYDEGRGAGLMNKFKAINIQQQEGLNTVQAYEKLGLKVDKDAYIFESAILKQVGLVAGLVLYTNNPRKKSALEANGISLLRVEPIIKISNDLVANYLEEKGDILNHDIEL